MQKRYSLLAILPEEGLSRAYFYNKEDKSLLPVALSDKTVFQFICAQQSLIFDLLSNFDMFDTAETNDDAGLNGVIKAEITIDSSISEKYGIKITKEILEKSVQ